MARPPRAFGMLAVVLLGAPGCHSDPPAPGAATFRRTASTAKLVEQLESDAAVPTLLALLGRRHRDVRGELGPHRLDYEAHFELAPVEDPGRPRVGEPVLTARAVVDTLTLEWASGPGEAPRFRLEQHNDADEGREVILIEDTVYTQLRHRSWHMRELDSELHELWLDDALHSMHDAVELAAPGLGIEVEIGEPVGGRETLNVSLQSARETNRDLVAWDPSTDWRYRADLESISGELVLDRGTGTWRSGTVEIAYSMADKRGRKLRGKLAIRGTLEPVAPGSIEISRPTAAQPLPERERYEVERAKLLDGLAAP